MVGGAWAGTVGAAAPCDRDEQRGGELCFRYWHVGINLTILTPLRQREIAPVLPGDETTWPESTCHLGVKFFTASETEIR